MPCAVGIGFAVWELMISDCLDCADTRRWKHGLMYTDGTTRDPAAIAAVRGIYLNRGDLVPLAVPRPDVEDIPSTFAKAASAWLASAPPPHEASHFSVGVGLLDGIANVVESAGLSLSAVALSGTVRQLAAAGGGEETLAELRAVLAAQISPEAALLGAAAGAEISPAVCVFNSSK